MAMSPKHAEILRLHTEEQLSYAEIAVRLGVALGTVKSRLNRARLAFKIENDRHPNGAPKWNAEGMLLDDQGNRSVFDDVDA